MIVLSLSPIAAQALLRRLTNRIQTDEDKKSVAATTGRLCELIEGAK